MQSFKILIATGLFPPDVGGPAEYAKHLFDEFNSKGHETKVIAYMRERAMPQGVRHIFYFFRLMGGIRRADIIFALDTFSVGVPAIFAGLILGKKVVLRIGGDFLWEAYVGRTRIMTPFPYFYKDFSVWRLNMKEKVIYWLSGFVLRSAAICAFNSEWQKDIFIRHYDLDEQKCLVVENYFSPKRSVQTPPRKNFLWAGRDIFLKNTHMLKKAFEDAKRVRPDIELELIIAMPRGVLIEKMKECYAVVLPSLSEMSPNFLIDAISMNKPFIATKYTGLYEKAKDIGLWVDPLDKKDITEKILMSVNDRIYEDYVKRIENFNYVRSWKDVADDFLKIFHDICG